MYQKTLHIILAFCCCAGHISAQFITSDEVFSANSVSNAGKVAGYAMQAGPYALWLPDSNNVFIEIGGLAPGNGVGGQARFSADGNLLCGTSMGPDGAEMSRYDRNTNQWTLVGSLGTQIDNTVSGGFGISGDGNTVAGNSWADATGGFAYTHAVAYNPTEGLLDLGSLFAADGRSTRANAVSYDGSVVVGWQDFNGPWKSAVWRKNPAGGYFPNEYILIDTMGSVSDEFNQMGECSSVSFDGTWIGGYGDYANGNQPWIWSRDSGVINLGTFPNAGNGFVSGMTADASVVVGWFDGQFFGDPQIPFIWTRTGGLQELNAYINDVLGYSTDTRQVYSAECISPDGHYIAGYGVDNSTFGFFVYRVSLDAYTGVHVAAQAGNTKVFPNPTTGLFTIENAGNATVTVSSMDGKVVQISELNDTGALDLTTCLPGIYTLTIQTGNSLQTRKIVKY
ncbi:MAG TPA: T9SS type A sorting domain-containing protein [Saprospiraceae bacterium]|nr:T9SS type A sorting domain-containing protein [Saprospiraceae bacterium]